MIRIPLLLMILSLFTLSMSAAGTIRFDDLETYDTGIRLANGRWKIGAHVKMSYFDFWGDPVPVDWEAGLWINNIHNGALLVGTGTQRFRSKVWQSSIEANANFDACYQGKSYARAAGEVLEVGGNHVCTLPRPLPDPPPCDDDCQSPIILSLRGGYHMTSPADGALFDIDADGIQERVSWTRQNSDVGFLALDRNGNGTIESGAELFGNSTMLANGDLAPNGFEALADLDSNRDGTIDAGDSVWQNLLLWLDMNHDGVSNASELVPVRRTDVNAISTDYKPSRKTDVFGNEFRYEGEFKLRNAWQKCYDVYLVTAD